MAEENIGITVIVEQTQANVTVTPPVQVSVIPPPVVKAKIATEGVQGPPGIQGQKGETGEKGEKGDQGEQGEKGEKGDTGNTGLSPAYIVVPLTVLAGVWSTVPLTGLSLVSSVQVYDDSNKQEVFLEKRINDDNSVQIRSTKNKTYNVRIVGV